MKKSFMSVTLLVVSISMVVMFLCSSSAKAQTSSNFVYNQDGNTETVYTLDKSGKYLTRKLKYEFQKDANGNVIEKKAFRWNSAKETWSPYYVLNFTEQANSFIVEYALWDNKEGNFSANCQKVIYGKNIQNDFITYHAYCWDLASQSWQISHHLLAQSYLAIK
ncbi:DUF3836 domain-containing protein [Bacteroides sp. 214]|uniref:DUF3836 domain-containing protein n=1 Tax=Bacteroides sp. 214 TaxID=2302935 RepID=UPI0013D45BEF|nr:DUF3836 domain-containing protein [Bacteroides sp. 214]NDW13079.1 DUF3836 domain-containing protein [Bacteroides sp. 214]